MTTKIDELVSWLRQQLDADERYALKAQHNRPSPWVGAFQQVTSEPDWDPSRPSHVAESTTVVASTYSADVSHHIELWEPARVLAEVEAKRRILDEYERATAAAQFPNREGGIAEGLEIAVYALAQPYASRPGFRDEWRLT